MLRPAHARMPTHRELARQLGVSVQTVSLSYKEAERRGYLRGEVGRGTFVRSRVTERADRFMLDRGPEDDRRSLDHPRRLYRERTSDASRRGHGGAGRARQQRLHAPLPADRRARAPSRRRPAWLQRPRASRPTTDRILITNGAAHGAVPGGRRRGPAGRSGAHGEPDRPRHHRPRQCAGLYACAACRPTGRASSSRPSRRPAPRARSRRWC